MAGAILKWPKNRIGRMGKYETTILQDGWLLSAEQYGLSNQEVTFSGSPNCVNRCRIRKAPSNCHAH